MGRSAAETRRELNALQAEMETSADGIRAALDDVGRELAVRPWLRLAVAAPLLLTGLALTGRRARAEGARWWAGSLVPVLVGAGLVLVAQRVLRGRPATAQRPRT